MKARARRCWRNSILLLIAAIAVLWAHAKFRGKLLGLDYLTGWALLGVVLFLAIYNGRQKLPFLPLGSSEAWLQLHIYIGYLALVIFLVHGNYHLPKGWFEICLATIFSIVML